MNFEMIWKSIDGEITVEEQALLQEDLNRDANFLESYESAKMLDEALSTKFSHKMDASFLTRLKSHLADEFAIPELTIKIYPAVVFAFVSILLTIIFYTYNNLSVTNSSFHLSRYTSYFSIILSISLGGLLLFGLDQWFKTRLDSRT